MTDHPTDPVDRPTVDGQRPDGITEAPESAGSTEAPGAGGPVEDGPATADPAGVGPRSVTGAAWRFVLAGGFNTLVTGVVLSGLSLVIDPRVAYTLVFAAGVALSTWMAHRFVFGVPLGRAGAAAYVAMYLAVYLIGLVALSVARDQGLPDAAGGLVVLVTAPLTFVGGRLVAAWVHRRRRESSPERITP